jgi:alpha-L-rhamnosidase
MRKTLFSKISKALLMLQNRAMNGNITKDGIKKDLDWMKQVGIEQVGIGGFQNFDANLFTPVVVTKKLVFMESDWKDA